MARWSVQVPIIAVVVDADIEAPEDATPEQLSEIMKPHVWRELAHVRSYIRNACSSFGDGAAYCADTGRCVVGLPYNSGGQGGEVVTGGPPWLSPGVVSSGNGNPRSANDGA